MYEHDSFTSNVDLVADIHFPQFSTGSKHHCLEMEILHLSGTVSLDIRNTSYITSKADTDTYMETAWIQYMPSGDVWNRVFIDIRGMMYEKAFLVLTVKDRSSPSNARIFALSSMKLHPDKCIYTQGE